MKKHDNYKPAITAIGTWWLANIVVAAKALHYVCAAQHDEHKCFAYTAAMEWRDAAGLFSSQMLAEYCWRQWERIMHLPRRLAGPLPNSLAATGWPGMTSSLNQVSVAVTA